MSFINSLSISSKKVEGDLLGLNFINSSKSLSSSLANFCRERERGKRKWNEWEGRKRWRGVILSFQKKVDVNVLYIDELVLISAKEMVMLASTNNNINSAKFKGIIETIWRNMRCNWYKIRFWDKIKIWVKI